MSTRVFKPIKFKTMIVSIGQRTFKYTEVIEELLTIDPIVIDLTTEDSDSESSLGTFDPAASSHGTHEDGMTFSPIQSPDYISPSTPYFGPFGLSPRYESSTSASSFIDFEKLDDVVLQSGQQQ